MLEAVTAVSLLDGRKNQFVFPRTSSDRFSIRAVLKCRVYVFILHRFPSSSVRPCLVCCKVDDKLIRARLVRKRSYTCLRKGGKRRGRRKSKRREREENEEGKEKEDEEGVSVFVLLLISAGPIKPHWERFRQ